MTFQAINTQEEFDERVKDRIAREAKKYEGFLSPEDAKKKYEGYLSPDEVSKKYEGYMSKEDIEKKYAGYASPEQIAEKDAKIQKYERDSVKMKAAHKFGLPTQFASRLTGDDEAAIEKDAESFAKAWKETHGGAPLRTNESDIEKDDNREALKGMLKGLKGE